MMLITLNTDFISRMATQFLSHCVPRAALFLHCCKLMPQLTETGRQTACSSMPTSFPPKRMIQDRRPTARWKYEGPQEPSRHLVG